MGTGGGPGGCRGVGLVYRNRPPRVYPLPHYLHDRLANPDSYGFYLRHQADFVTDYASTDPSEDIAESFTYFVLWDAPEGDAVWEEKLNFFYRYPELVEFRTQARARLGL